MTWFFLLPLVLVYLNLETKRRTCLYFFFGTHPLPSPYIPPSIPHNWYRGRSARRIPILGKYKTYKDLSYQLESHVLPDYQRWNIEILQSYSNRHFSRIMLSTLCSPGVLILFLLWSTKIVIIDLDPKSGNRGNCKTGYNKKHCPRQDIP